MTKEFKIEAGVPLPLYENTKYPFGKLKIGQSFLAHEKTVRAAAYKYGRYNNLKFKTRAEGDGIRIWRTA